MVLEGYDEAKDEHLRTEVATLFRDLGLDYGAEKVESISRKGKYIPDAKRPRPVVMYLNSKTVKGDVFKNIRKLQDKPKWHGVSIVDELNESEKRQYNDLRSIFFLAKLKGLAILYPSLTMVTSYIMELL